MPVRWPASARWDRPGDDDVNPLGQLNSWVWSDTPGATDSAGFHSAALAASQLRAKNAAHTWSMSTPRQKQFMRIVSAGVAGIAILAFLDAAPVEATTDMFGHVRFAADDNDDAQLQQQLAQQQLLLSEQQAEQQNEAAQQQFEQDMQQAQLTEQQANNP